MSHKRFLKGVKMKDERRFIEINPFNKIDEILDIFKQHNPRVFMNTDKGYDWIEEDDSKCIVFENPYGGESLEILVGDFGEFTLYFNQHAHYDSYQYDYDLMIKTIRDIFCNRICAGRIEDKNGKWYGGGYFDKSEITEQPQKVFEYIFKHKEFFDHLTKVGYKVKYCFWNPIDDITINND